jgi:hypothetical protein
MQQLPLQRIMQLLLYGVRQLAVAAYFHHPNERCHSLIVPEVVGVRLL